VEDRRDHRQVTQPRVEQAEGDHHHERRQHEAGLEGEGAAQPREAPADEAEGVAGDRAREALAERDALEEVLRPDPAFATDDAMLDLRQHRDPAAEPGNAQHEPRA